MMEHDAAFAALLKEADPQVKHFLNSIFENVIDQAKESSLSLADFLRQQLKKEMEQQTTSSSELVHSFLSKEPAFKKRSLRSVVVGAFSQKTVDKAISDKITDKSKLNMYYAIQVQKLQDLLSKQLFPQYNDNFGKKYEELDGKIFDNKYLEQLEAKQQ